VIFPLHLSKVLHLPRKSVRSAAPVMQNHLSKPEDLMPQINMQPLSGNQRPGPDLPTSLMEMSLVLRLPRDMHLRRSFSNVPLLPLFLHVLRNPHVFLTFDKGAESIAHPPPSPILTSKSGPGPSVFKLLTCECSSRHNGVHLFDISSAKIASEVWCF
jgi:hypothetical protein